MDNEHTQVGLGTVISPNVMIEEVWVSYTDARNKRGRRYGLSDRALDRSFAQMFETMDSCYSFFTTRKDPAAARREAEEKFEASRKAHAEEQSKQTVSLVTESVTQMVPVIVDAVKEALAK